MAQQLGSNYYKSPYKFNGKELDEETGFYYYGARYYDPRISIWLSVNPLAEKMPCASPYNYCFGNPVNLVDVDGLIPIPLFDKFKTWFWKIDSYFGKRDTGLVGASKFHKGLDFNYSGGGDSDYGAPILTTHDGTVTTADTNPAKGEGRMVVVTSEDNEFRTRYFHLSKVEVKKEDKVSESDKIGEMGGSANGKEKGRQVHLHYEIQKKDKDGKWQSIDATEGKGKSPKNVVDSQKWVIKKKQKH